MNKFDVAIIIGNLLAIVYGIFLLNRMLFITHELQRILVSKFGTFERLLGPGLVIVNPFTSKSHSRLSVGNRGKLLTANSADFFGVVVPVTLKGDARVEDAVVITKFPSLLSEVKIEVEKDTRQVKSILCEKCGHENVITA